jgi:hypothetical protein
VAHRRLPPASSPDDLYANESALASIVLGILGVVMAILIAFIGVGLGIGALIFGRMGRLKAEETGIGMRRATIGRVTGALAVVGGIVNFLIALANPELAA